MTITEQVLRIDVRGGVLYSLEKQVAMIRVSGFRTEIRIARPEANGLRDAPLTLLVENVRGYEVEIAQRGGQLENLIRSSTAVMFDVTGFADQTISICYPAQADEFDFFCFGDTHGVFRYLREIISAANARHPLFVMANGDMTHSGRLADYSAFADLIGQADMPFFTAIGNHDKRTWGSRKTYRTLLAPLDYAFDVHQTRFIIIDSSRKRGLSRPQYVWLERELRAAAGKRIFVFLHRPPICPKYNYLAFSMTANANHFMRLMETYRVEMVFGSHVHVLTGMSAISSRAAAAGRYGNRRTCIIICTSS